MMLSNLKMIFVGKEKKIFKIFHNKKLLNKSEDDCQENWTNNETEPNMIPSGKWIKAISIGNKYEKLRLCQKQLQICF